MLIDIKALADKHKISIPTNSEMTDIDICMRASDVSHHINISDVDVIRVSNNKYNECLMVGISLKSACNFYWTFYGKRADVLAFRDELVAMINGQPDCYSRSDDDCEVDGKGWSVDEMRHKCDGMNFLFPGMHNDSVNDRPKPFIYDGKSHKIIKNPRYELWGQKGVIDKKTLTPEELAVGLK